MENVNPTNSSYFFIRGESAHKQLLIQALRFAYQYGEKYDELLNSVKENLPTYTLHRNSFKEAFSQYFQVDLPDTLQEAIIILGMAKFTEKSFTDLTSQDIKSVLVDLVSSQEMTMGGQDVSLSHTDDREDVEQENYKRQIRGVIENGSRDDNFIHYVNDGIARIAKDPLVTRSSDPYAPTKKGLSAVLPEGAEITEQDKLNNHIFTVKIGDKKSYWFLNVLTHQYQQITEYEQTQEKEEKMQHGWGEALGNGAVSYVYSRRYAPSLGVKPLVCFGNIKESNLFLSLLYSIKNEDFRKYINIGFIKSGEDGKMRKMVLPRINGGTIPQLTNEQISTFVRFTDRIYFKVSGERRPIIEAARKQFLEEDIDLLLQNVIDKHNEFLWIAREEHGLFIHHSDFKVTNLMYDMDNRNLVIVDSDSWMKDTEYVDSEKEIESIKLIVSKAHGLAKEAELKMDQLQ